MSCTENDSGPFVVFFLPAVVGCLTILLARRWANTQVSSSSSTAISRRRKIIKDPLIKRPLPPIACKMVPPISKKSSGVSKKGSVPVVDDDNGKRGRSVRAPTACAAAAAFAELKSDGPPPPKHIPFPNIPHDGVLLFEVMMFVFTLVATGLQFLNLYRTAWWLPHSFTNQAMNFYLIDPHLVVFIVTLISRRFVMAATLSLIRTVVTAKLMPSTVAAARMFILGLVVGILAWCAYFILLKHPIVKLFYLCYPIVIYVVLFGFQSSPLLELNSGPPPLHCCSHVPSDVRQEADTLREDFNLRIKKILFNSVAGAYYSSFIPCCFAQSYLYYDVYGASQQVVFVWGCLFGRYAHQLLPATYCDVLHRSAIHLGSWRLHSTSIEPNVGLWICSVLWSQGALASFQGRTYAAAAPTVAAQPNNSGHARFYSVFINPSTLLCLLLVLQLAFIVLELCLLFSSLAWHNFMSILILLFINYYTLFKMMRDYLVAWKVYKAEHMIQDKNASHSN
ncbi:transmembrane protein 39A [Ostrinia furnacalis]|uniref:transmembrane protein 39A n=2 Tax=Ostrinia furnacalis TaxID=93504 RepID=UPI001038BA09|nr:transmembrane protein 39A [Ostrinia furnacalis]